MSRSDLTRLSVNLNPETAEALKAVVGAQGISYAEGIRAAISMLAFVENVRAAGETLIVESADRTQTRELIGWHGVEREEAA